MEIKVTATKPYETGVEGFEIFGSKMTVKDSLCANYLQMIVVTFYIEV